ncbi:sulfite exporter TauE/SafE family protein [Litoribrevibacter euphylliae]|uniref:Sulfite exporter TauE/SafE family protein n=1 Tax=Litoribrevibacter euphylliae TaxID=1834034 RepID=A0ABV7HB42_9GAMM
MTVETLSFTAAFLIGLLGGAHCIGMCGGITGTFGLNSQGSLVERFIKNLSFNLGRISSYTLIGLIVGLASSLLTNLSPTIGMILRLVAGIFIILMGLYVADWSRAITKIEKPGQWVWKHIQPLTKPFLPADTIKKSLFLGLLWGWLPCGLVYSTLVLASANASPTSSAMVMAAFGLGTLPTMLATGLLASQLSNIIRNKNVRNLAAIMMILMGAWIIWGNSQHLLGHGDHSSHNNHMNHSSHSNHGDHTNHSDHENHDSSNTSNHEGHSMHDHSAMQTESQVDHSTMDHSQMDHSGMNRSQMDHTDMSSDTRKQDHSHMDHSEMDHSKMNH